MTLTYETIKSKLCNLRKGKLNGKWVSILGTYFEKAFEFMCEEKGRTVVPSTDAQDALDHIDYWVNETPVDVKAPKHYKKNYDDFPNTILLELTNVNGYAGWLRGKSKYIVFGYDAHPDFYFLIYDRQELLDWTEQQDFNFITRDNRKDKFVWVVPPKEGLKAKIKCNKYLEKTILFFEELDARNGIRKAPESTQN